MEPVLTKWPDDLLITLDTGCSQGDHLCLLLLSRVGIYIEKRNTEVADIYREELVTQCDDIDDNAEPLSPVSVVRGNE